MPAKTTFLTGGTDCLVILPESSYPLNDLIVAGPTATAVFKYGGRIPSIVNGTPIRWVGEAKYDAGVVNQDGEWWVKWCDARGRSPDKFEPVPTYLRFDSRSELLVYGFDKPGVFHISIRLEDRPGTILRVTEAVMECGLDILQTTGLTTARNSGHELTVEILAGASRPIDADLIRVGLLETLETDSDALKVDGQPLTEADLRSVVAQQKATHSVFISYSREDQEFVFQLHNFLVNSGIRCWLDDHELLPGDKLHDAIQKGVQESDRFLLVCSEASLRSWWVDNELEEALAKEREADESSLVIPIAIDRAVFEDPPLNSKCTQIRSRYIGDFRDWNCDEQFADAANKLLLALQRDERPLG